MKHFHRPQIRGPQSVPRQSQQHNPRRRGSITVMAALVLVRVFGFSAFAVDIGYVVISKGQMQNAAYAGVLAGLLELGEGLGRGAVLTAEEDAAQASDFAVATVAA